MSELMHMFACRILIIQKMRCIIIFLLGALVACGPAKESWSMFIIKDVTLCFDRANQVRSS